MSANLSVRLAHRLTPDVIRKVVAPNSSGTYRLHRDGAVVYLGRSDTNLRRRLLEQATARRGDHFTWQLHATALGAYTDECSQWHNLPHLAQNLVHPARPDGVTDRCPFCPESIRLIALDRTANRNHLEPR